MSDLAGDVLATARAMNASGINRGAAGNVSARCADGFLITPTGMPYDECMPADMAKVSLGGTASGNRKPSSEWRFHRDIYVARPEAGAVIHCHSPFATSLACQEVEIPPFHYMIARFGGDTVRCAAYATFGTQELSDAVLAALDDRRACLMAHHGMLVFGANLKEALALTIELESLCEQFWRVLQLGQPRLLPEGEMLNVLNKFKDYGRQD
ncbi:MAG: class II aldolase/adducin family protein [Pseudomonadota bacterium]